MKETLTPLFDDPAILAGAGYDISKSNDIYRVLKPDFAKKIAKLERVLQKSRTDYTRHFIDNPGLFRELPHGMGSELHSGWTTRQLDLNKVNEFLVNDKPKQILEVGSWNGWLSQYLARDGRLLTAIDYFKDDYDGLGAKRHYPENWLAVQMDLADLSILTGKFDLIIANHCLGFMINPADWIKNLSGKLQPGGTLIATGLMFYQNPQQKAQEVQQSCKQFKAKYGVDMFLHPAKGYLDIKDRQRLIENGMEFKRYPERSLVRKLLGLFPGRQKIEWGIIKRQ